MSDQDFFFDEDEKPAAKSGAKKGSTPAKTVACPRAAAPAEQPERHADGCRSHRRHRHSARRRRRPVRRQEHGDTGRSPRHDDSAQAPAA